MLRKQNVLYLFLFVNSFLFTQNNKKGIISNYEINIVGTSQTISISKYNNNKYDGYLISGTKTYKYKGKYYDYSKYRTKNLCSTIEYRGKLVSDSVKLNSEKVNKLIKRLKRNKFEPFIETYIQPLIDENIICYDKKTKKKFTATTGETIFFRLKTKKTHKTIAFSNVNYKMKSTETCTDKGWKKANKFYSILKKEIDLVKYWKDFNTKYKISEFKLETPLKSKGYNFTEPLLNLDIMENVR